MASAPAVDEGFAAELRAARDRLGQPREPWAS
jgi:hypothetical protein